MSIRDRINGSTPADPTPPENIDAILDARALRIDRDQSTTAGQKAQGLENLGLGNSSTRNVGTTAGTVAAGDDARFSDVPAASLASTIHAATSKTTPVDADELPISDSAASWGLKKLTWANIKATLAGLFASRASNLSDLASASTARTNLGLGTLATQNGTFSGTSSGTNTGDQDISGLIPRLSTITITGTTPAFPGPLVESTTLNNGRRQWFGPGNAELRATSTDNWNLSFDDGTNSYLASKVSESDEPWKISGWGGHTGPSSDPIFSIDPPVLLPVNGASGTTAIVTDTEGRVSSSDMIGLGTGVATALAVNVGSAGAFVTFNGALGTPSSGTLTSCTGLPISTGVSGLGTNIATFLATPTSANLAAAITNETGSGSLVFATSPALVTPLLGTPTSGNLTNCTGYSVKNLADVQFSLAATDLVRAAGVSGSDLTATLASGKTYRVNAMVKMTGSAGGSFISSISGPNCSFGISFYERAGFEIDTIISSLSPLGTSNLHSNTGATSQTIKIEMIIKTSASGTLAFGWTAVSATGTRTAGSYLRVELLD
jgi:hypothetical protein